MTFSKTVQDAILKRREKIHIYDKLDATRTALVVIDMQNAFCKPQGVLSVDSARSIVPNVNRLAEATRSRGGSVFWVQMKIASEARWPIYLGEIVTRREPIDRILQDLSPTSEGTALWPELDVREDDTLVEKDRFSAFLPSACNLTELLDDKGIDTVIIVGTLTNVCCESSARDAAMQDYRVVFVSDANAARDHESQTRSLEAIGQFFGDVRTTDETIRLLEGGE